MRAEPVVKSGVNMLKMQSRYTKVARIDAVTMVST